MSKCDSLKVHRSKHNNLALSDQHVVDWQWWELAKRSTEKQLEGMKMTQMDKVSTSRVGTSKETRTLLEMVRIYWLSMFLRKMQKCSQTKYYAGYESSKANVSPEWTVVSTKAWADLAVVFVSACNSNITQREKSFISTKHHTEALLTNISCLPTNQTIHATSVYQPTSSECLLPVQVLGIVSIAQLQSEFKVFKLSCDACDLISKIHSQRDKPPRSSRTASSKHSQNRSNHFTQTVFVKIHLTASCFHVAVNKKLYLISNKPRTHLLVLMNTS